MQLASAFIFKILNVLFKYMTYDESTSGWPLHLNETGEAPAQKRSQIIFKEILKSMV